MQLLQMSFFFNLLTDTLYLKKKFNKRQKTAPRGRPGKTKKKNVISWRCERAPVSPAAGLNLKKLSSRHLKVFTPDKVLS